MIKLSSGVTQGLRKITPSEKISINEELTHIQEEYITLVEASQLDGISNTTEYSSCISAYKNLYHYLVSDPGLLTERDSVSYVDPVEYQNIFNDYYSAKNKLACLIILPPTNQIKNVSLAWSDDGNKGILVQLEFEYVQGIIPATHFVLFQNVDIITPSIIDPDTASLTQTIRADTKINLYKIEFILPQTSVTTQLHYRLAISAASLGAAGFKLAGPLVDGGESWRDITVVQEPQAPDITTMPVRSVYIQFHGQDTPENIWGGTWENISGNFAGEFFRAEGGAAAGFGGTQAEGLPNITGGFSAYVSVDSAASGCFTQSIPSFAYQIAVAGRQRDAPINLNATRSSSIYGASSHVTPYNSSIRIWIRIS